MPDFIFADFLTTGLVWWSYHPAVVTLTLAVAIVVCWLALVRWLENSRELTLVQRHRKAVQDEIDAAKREREADQRRRQMDAVARISDRRRG